MRRAPAGVALPLVVLLVCGCAHPRPPLEPRSGDAGGGSDTRRPPGVTLDPPTAYPPGRADAAASEGIAVLLSPVDAGPALRVVDAYFAAIIAESSEGVEGVLDAGAEIRAAPKTRAEPALAALRRRFERLDYGVLSAELPYRPSEREVTTSRGLQGPTAEASGLPVFPRGDDVVVRVPIVSRVGTLLGSEIVLLLRRRGSTYKIGEIYEDFRLP